MYVYTYLKSVKKWIENNYDRKSQCTSTLGFNTYFVWTLYSILSFWATSKKGDIISIVIIWSEEVNCFFFLNSEIH